MLSGLLLEHIDYLVCPGCGGTLRVSDAGGLACSTRNHMFPCDNGVPPLFWPNEWEDSKHDVTPSIKSFNEKTPFPDYENLDSVESLRQKARKGFFARWLDEKIGYGAKVLEVGCGIGQLSSFLGTVHGRTVLVPTCRCHHYGWTRISKCGMRSNGWFSCR